MTGWTGHVVLVHGAWYGAWCWDGVVAELERRDVPVTAVELPLTGFANDVVVARGAIEAAGTDSVVVGHSYGGAVITQAAAGQPVARLVYLAAFLTEPAEDTTALMAGSPLMESLVIGETGITVDPTAAAEVVEWATDHSPFLTRPAGIAELVTAYLC